MSLNDIEKKVKIRFLILISIIAVLVNTCTPDNTSPNSNDTRDKIVDTWNCSETVGPFGAQSFQVDISKDPNNSTRVFLDNFFDLKVGSGVYATMSGLQLNIPSQKIVISQNDQWTFSGTGSISNNYKSITLNYTADDGNGPKQVIDNLSLP